MQLWTDTWIYKDRTYVCDRAKEIVSLGGVLPSSASRDTRAHFELWQIISKYMYKHLGRFHTGTRATSPAMICKVGWVIPLQCS